MFIFTYICQKSDKQIEEFAICSNIGNENKNGKESAGGIQNSVWNTFAATQRRVWCAIQYAVASASRIYWSGAFQESRLRKGTRACSGNDRRRISTQIALHFFGAQTVNKSHVQRTERCREKQPKLTLKVPRRTYQHSIRIQTRCKTSVLHTFCTKNTTFFSFTKINGKSYDEMLNNSSFFTLINNF